MAFSYKDYTGDGATDTFTITFTYQDTNEISVTVDGVAETGLTFPSTTTVQLTSAPASDALVRVRRTTSLTSRSVDFASGSVLTEEDLDNSNIQVFHAAQEAIDTSNDAISLDDDDKWDANSKVIKNVATPVSDNDATNKAYVDQIEADATAAQTAAEAAQAAAETAETNAAASAATATTKASEASTSASNAATSASASSTSATSSATSATASASSATAAAASAAAAAVSETNAATSESNASTSETNAASSASSASTSASTATTQAGIATTKAVEAATSATNAATSESNAATSETNAATSESNAASSATAAAASQVSAAASAASAASAFDNFDDTYLGSYSSDPIVDNDGDALVQGALYFNSTANEMRVFDGGSWIAASSAGGASLTLFEYTATAGQTTFSGADDNAATLSYTLANIIVTLNGITLDPSDYTATSGTSIVLASGAALNDELNIIAFKSFTTADMVSATNGGTFGGNVTWADNAKAIFGAGSDLQIYHNGSNSFIDDAGTGVLFARSNQIKLQKYTGEDLATFVADGAVTLYHNNASKLATTATGVSVTGTVAATSFSGDGSGLSNVGGNPPTIQVFTTSGTGTWTKPSGCKSIKVTVVGGGGGGGSARGQDSSCNVAAGGGGAGGASIKYIDVTSVSSATVTRGAGGSAGTGGGSGGAGGTSSFGSYCSATGGNGGQGISTTGNQCGYGGSTGVGASGDINIEGGNGHHAQLVAGGLPVSGAGGVSLFGGGGKRLYRTSTGGTAGDAGTLGGGGSGSATRDQGSSQNGGVGGAGIVVVEEYY
jgi:hypothetical protein